MATTEAVTNLPKITKPPLKMASLKDAKAVIEEGGCTIWGQLPDIPYKSNKLAWVSLQGLKGPFVVLVLEDLLYASIILGLTL